jgi:uncharacterized protein (TIGR02300 family)
VHGIPVFAKRDRIIFWDYSLDAPCAIWNNRDLGEKQVWTVMDLNLNVIHETWGTKRICHACSTRFYDMNKPQIVCPKCETPFSAESILKSRGARIEREADFLPKADVAVDIDDIDIPDDDFIPGNEDDIDADLDPPHLGEDEEDV